MEILLADDQELIIYSLAGIISDEFPKANLQQTNCGLQLEKLARSQTWDIIISDILMPDKTGLEVLKQLRSEGIKTPMLIISVCPESQYAQRILKAGGNGYFVKTGTKQNFILAIQTILNGKKYISPEALENMASLFDESQTHEAHQLISDRELEILKHIGSGKLVSEIATLLSLSVSTICTYRQRLLKKIHLHSSAELMHYAITNHLEI